MLENVFLLSLHLDLRGFCTRLWHTFAMKECTQALCDAAVSARKNGFWEGKAADGIVANFQMCSLWIRVYFFVGK